MPKQVIETAASRLRHPEAQKAAALVETYLEAILNFGEKDDIDMETLEKAVIPEAIADDCVNVINSRTYFKKDIACEMAALRKRWHHMRVRVLKFIVDQDGTSTLERGKVGAIYEVTVGTDVAIQAGSEKQRPTERTTTVVSMNHIQASQIVRFDVVFDTTELHATTDDEPQLDCVIS